MGEEGTAVADFASMAIEQCDFIKPSMRAPMEHLLTSGAKRIDAAERQLIDKIDRLEHMANQAAQDLQEFVPQIHVRLGQVESFAERGHELVEGIESRLDITTQRLRGYMQLGVGMSARLQEQVAFGGMQIDAIVEQGYDISHRLESHARTCAERFEEMTQRSLELSAKAEDRLLRLNEMNLKLQQFVERYQGSAQEFLSRSAAMFALLETSAHHIQATTDFAYRAFSAVGFALAFPLRLIVKSRKAIGMLGSELSIRQVGLQSAIGFECRMPLAPILPGIVIEQSIAPKRNGLTGVSLTFNRFPEGSRQKAAGIGHKTVTSNGLTPTVYSSTVRVGIVDGEGRVLRETTLEAAKLPDNVPVKVEFERLDQSARKRYRLRITSCDSCPGNAVTVWSRITGAPRGMTFCGKIVDDAELIVDLDYSKQKAGQGAEGRGGEVTGPTPTSHSSQPHNLTTSQPRTASPADRDLLIVCPDRLGGTRIGLAMRHWEIALALSQSGLRVTLASTQKLPDEIPEAPYPIVDFSSHGDHLLETARRHSTIMVQGAALKDCPWLRELGRPLIADMVTPFHIENLQTNQEDFERSLAIITDSLAWADFFVCGNERQRIYWLGMLTALGRLSKTHRDSDAEFRKLIDVVGFGIPSEEPRASEGCTMAGKLALKGVVPGIHAGDFVLTWFGGIWDWLDPLPLVRGVVAAHQANPRIKLYFSMYRRDNDQPTRSAQRVRNLAIQLRALDKSIFFSELPAPFDRRADYLLDSDMGVILQSANFETQISARTRAMDYLWANLPILINRGDEIADLVESQKLGLVLGSSDPKDIARSLLAYVNDVEGIAQARQLIQERKSRFQWSSMVQPLSRFCREVATAGCGKQ